jgi:hypothetical protein
VRDDLREPARIHAPHDLVGAERSFAGGAPHVDTVGVQHEYPRIAAGQMAPERVEGQLVVRRDEHRRAVIGRAHSVEAGIDEERVASDAPADTVAADAVAPRELRGNDGCLAR